MRLRFLGAAREVTGSLYVLETTAGSLIVDCGLYQGRREESTARNRRLPPEAVSASAAILTHAHIDHSGGLPTLVKAGFRGPIYATPATRDLAAYMLRDSARIQEGDADYLNRRNADDPAWVKVTPLYTEDDAIRTLERFVCAPYGHAFSPLPGVTARFLDAGHILGSAEVRMRVGEGASARELLLTGDLGRKGLPILRDPTPPEGHVDYVVMESTYGNRVHGSIAEMHDDLARVVADTAGRGGKVIIPAFAVGRTQEILYALHVLRVAGRLPSIPIFIDSPLSVNVTEVFKLHPECYDAETRRFLEEHGDVFGFTGVTFVTSREASMGLNGLAGPAIIISSSGMAEAGRILHHLRNNVEDERNAILIVGYQAQHTLGRRLVERRPRVRILGVERELHARVHVMDAFSAHADRDDLVAFATACGPSTRRIFLTHGEPDQQEPLLATLGARGLAAHAPTRGEVAELE